ncbi:MAG: SRPBCC family protein [Pseudomonadales bacterium]|nr:SRPBCC family protein [Pseudomonadales bacterium]
MSREVTSRVIIEIPREQAWARLRDLSLAHNYVPGIVRTEITGEQTQGVGASRYVYRGAKTRLQETVVEWREGEGFTIRLHRGDRSVPPFHSASFSYQLADHGPQQTLLTTTMRFAMPWGALGRWLEKLMEKPVAATVADVAMAMKLYYESGQPTTATALAAYKVAARRRGR